MLIMNKLIQKGVPRKYFNTRYMVRMLYAAIFIFLCINSTIESTQNVYDVKDIEDIEFIAEFPEYEDDAAYGIRPNYLEKSHLRDLNPLVDWDDPTTFMIKNPKKVYVAKLQNAQVASYLLGTIFHKDQQLLFNISWSPTQSIFWPGTKKINKKRYKKLATVQGPTFFYHSIIDRLPSVMLLRDTVLSDPEVTLLINKMNSIPHYLLEYLDLMNIPKNQIEVANSNIYYADELFFATPFLMEPIPKKLLKNFRNELVFASEQRPLSRQYKRNLIVIIQRSENDRKIKNIDALINMIKEIYPSDEYEIVLFNASTSVAEQIQIFNHAKIVIGLMASGLTNIIYANPGTTIIDIRPDFRDESVGSNNSGREWCWWLSSVFDLDYWPLPHHFQLSDTWVVCPIDNVKKILLKKKNKLENIQI